MDYQIASFRWGHEHLGESNPEWIEILKVISSITAQEILGAKRQTLIEWRNHKPKSGGKSKKPPVGGQQILNGIIHEKLLKLGWEPQVYVLDESQDVVKGSKGTKRLNYWSMDFKKDLIGIEVSFNNAGVLAQNLLRLSVMAENTNRSRERMIRLGVLITANESLKKWSNMDSTVLTFESVCRVMPQVNLNIPTPIVLVGLNNSNDGVLWQETNLFGHKTLPEFDGLSATEQTFWNAIIDKR